MVTRNPMGYFRKLDAGGDNDEPIISDGFTSLLTETLLYIVCAPAMYNVCCHLAKRLTDRSSQNILAGAQHTGTIRWPWSPSGFPHDQHPHLLSSPANYVHAN
jgi:hypothetical protein